MSKRLTLIIIILLAIILIGGLIFYYIYFFSPNGPNGQGNSGFPDNSGQNGNQGNNQSGSNPDFPGDNQNNGGVIVLDSDNALSKLTSKTVSGARFVENSEEEMVRFVERGSGNIYDITQFETRVTNETVPRIQEVLWVNNLAAIMRYIGSNQDKVESFYATFEPKSDEGEITETGLDREFLSEGIMSIDNSPRESKIAYIVEDFDGGGILYTSEPNGDEKDRIFETPLREWIVEWPSNNIVTLNSKASFDSRGRLLFINPRNGAADEVLSNIFGLTSKTSEDGKYVIFSEARDGITTYILDVENESIEELSIKTLPEKCVWGREYTEKVYCAVPDSVRGVFLPDTWYQGQVSLSDDFYEINAQNGIANMLFDAGSKLDFDLDVIDIMVNDDDTKLMFRNKIDYSLWQLDLTVL